MNKSKFSPVSLIGILGFAAWFVFLRTGFKPIGRTIIDQEFMNELKWMTVAKCAILVVCIALIIVPVFVRMFRSDSARLIGVAGLVVCLIALVVTVLLNIGFFTGTPVVETHKVVDNQQIVTKMDLNKIYFEDGRSVFISDAEYVDAFTKPDKYVVSIDDKIIGVFDTKLYTLAAK